MFFFSIGLFIVILGIAALLYVKVQKGKEDQQPEG